MSHNYGMFLRVYASFQDNAGFKVVNLVLRMIDSADVSHLISDQNLNQAIKYVLEAKSPDAAATLDGMFDVFGERAYDALQNFSNDEINGLMENASAHTQEALQEHISKYDSDSASGESGQENSNYGMFLWTYSDFKDDQGFETVSNLLTTVKEKGIEHTISNYDLQKVLEDVVDASSQSSAFILSKMIELFGDRVLNILQSEFDLSDIQQLIDNASDSVRESLEGHLDLGPTAEDLLEQMKVAVEQGDITALHSIVNNLSSSQVDEISGNKIGELLVELATGRNDNEAKNDAISDILSKFDDIDVQFINESLLRTSNADNLEGTQIILNALTDAQMDNLDAGRVNALLQAMSQKAGINYLDQGLAADIFGQLFEGFNGDITQTTLEWSLDNFLIQGNLEIIVQITDTLSADQLSDLKITRLDSAFHNILSDHAMSTAQKSAIVMDLVKIFGADIQSDTYLTIVENAADQNMFGVLDAAIEMINSPDFDFGSKTLGTALNQIAWHGHTDALVYALEIINENGFSIYNEDLYDLAKRVITHPDIDSEGSTIVVNAILSTFEGELPENIADLFTANGFLNVDGGGVTIENLLTDAAVNNDHKAIADTLNTMTADDIAELDIATVAALESAGVVFGSENGGYVTTDDDVFIGGSAKDSIRVNADDVNVVAGDGNDWISSIHKDGNTFYGGEGKDTLYVMYGEGENTLDGGAGDDFVASYYTEGDDVLRGGDGNDRIQVLDQRNGNENTDQKTLDGGSGNDQLYSYNSGDDILIGGDGSDLLYGGGGADTFVFKQGETGMDTISQFSSAQGDKIDLSDYLSEVDVNQAAIDNFVSIRNESGRQIVSVRSSVDEDFTDVVTLNWGSSTVGTDDIITAPAHDTDII